MFGSQTGIKLVQRAVVRLGGSQRERRGRTTRRLKAKVFFFNVFFCAGKI